MCIPDLHYYDSYYEAVEARIKSKQALKVAMNLFKKKDSFRSHFPKPKHHRTHSRHPKGGGFRSI